MEAEKELQRRPENEDWEARVRGFEEELKRKDERYAYLYAELENFRKRTNHELEQMRRYGWEELASDLLDVVDSLQLAIRYAKDAPPELRDGIDLTLKKFVGVLEKHGMRVVTGLEQAFDPHFHEAVAVEPSNLASGTVLREISPGYTLHERLLRPARVIVSGGNQKKTA